jgi:dCTP deaminase
VPLPANWAEYFRPRQYDLETRRPNPTREIKIPDEGIILQPGVLYLGHTVERIGSRKYVPQMVARSSMGRLGLFIFLNSGLGDIGFIGQWTMEMYVCHPLRLRKGERVGQMIFNAVQGEIVQYNGKYQDAKGPQASLVYRDDPSSSIAHRRPIKYLLLDAGGVLVSERGTVEALVKETTQQSGCDEADVWAFWNREVRVPLWTGRLSIAAAVACLNKQFGSKLDGWRPHDVQLLPWAEEALSLLSPPQVGLLSNHRSEWLLPCLDKLKTRALRTRSGDKFAPRCCVSDAIGHAKPDQAAYRYAFAQLAGSGATHPGEVLFVDNKQINLDAAKEFGMQVLLADPAGAWVAQARQLIEESNR